MGERRRVKGVRGAAEKEKRGKMDVLCEWSGVFDVADIFLFLVYKFQLAGLFLFLELLPSYHLSSV